MEKRLSHFDKCGNAIMVDISEKEVTRREAVAKGTIKVTAEILEAVASQTVLKGDVLGVARLGGIMGVKKTSDLILLCHPLEISECSVDFEIDKKSLCIHSICRVKTQGKTGVEMEALTGVSAALLTIYDMCKGISKEMEISDIRLSSKSGGKSGDYRRKEK